MTHGFSCGSSHADILIPISASSIFILNMNPTPSQTPTALNPINFSNFEYSTIGTQSFPLVPYSDYKKQYKCSSRAEECRTIYHDFHPEIVFHIDPAVLRGVDPEWKRCGNKLHTAHDPPIAIPPVASVAPPKVTGTKAAADCGRISRLAMPTQTPGFEGARRMGRVTVLATEAIPAAPSTTDSCAARETPQPTRQVEILAIGGTTMTVPQRTDGAFLLDGEPVLPGQQTMVGGVKISAFGEGVVVDYGGAGTTVGMGGGKNSAVLGLRRRGWRSLRFGLVVEVV
jgi:hypothetical protein